jgi:hypothetical protein
VGVAADDGTGKITGPDGGCGTADADGTALGDSVGAAEGVAGTVGSGGSVGSGNGVGRTEGRATGVGGGAAVGVGGGLGGAVGDAGADGEGGGGGDGAALGGAMDGGGDTTGGDGTATGAGEITGPISKPMRGSGENRSVGGVGATPATDVARGAGDMDGITAFTGEGARVDRAASPREVIPPPGVPSTGRMLPRVLPGSTVPVLT